MRAHVVLMSVGGQRHVLGHGALIGRLRSAALPIDDPRVSEAHALVSLRGETLKLLALRGRLHLDGDAHVAITLAPGQVIGLAPGVALTVVDVALPATVVGLGGDGLPRQPLGGVQSLFVKPRPRLAPGVLPDADAVLWGEGDRYRLRTRDGERDLALGDAFSVDDRRFELVAIALRDAAVPSTLGTTAPVRIVASYDTVQVHQNDLAVVIAGLGARLICELIELGGPVAWDVLAAELWGPGEDTIDLRPRFDMTMTRLRRRLRQAGIRDDLVVLTGTGQVELVLRPGDHVEDRI